MRNKDEKHYRGIEKLTDNPFLNLYHIDALGRDGTGRRFTIILLPAMVRIISNIRLIACAPKVWRSMR